MVTLLSLAVSIHFLFLFLVLCFGTFYNYIQLDHISYAMLAQTIKEMNEK
jgi:hypothetical protein